MIAEIQCLPTPTGTPESAYAHIDAAIAVVADSGLTYEVGALGTTFEGPPDEMWTVLRRAHEATLGTGDEPSSGAGSVVTVLKVFQTAPDDAAGATTHGPGIDDLVAAHR